MEKEFWDALSAVVLDGDYATHFELWEEKPYIWLKKTELVIEVLAKTSSNEQ